MSAAIWYVKKYDERTVPKPAKVAIWIYVVLTVAFFAAGSIPAVCGWIGG